MNENLTANVTETAVEAAAGNGSAAGVTFVVGVAVGMLLLKAIQITGGFMAARKEMNEAYADLGNDDYEEVTVNNNEDKKED